MRYLLLLLCCFSLGYCQINNEGDPSQPVIDHQQTVATPTVDTTPVVETTSNLYFWQQNYDVRRALVNQIRPPAGYQRIEMPAGSFADWLRFLPLRPDDDRVYLFDGSLKANQQAQHAVIDLDVGKRDLQQCADAVMRLKAEYHFSKKDFAAIHFNFTSGHTVSFEDWRKGRKPRISGNSVRFSPRTGHVDNSYENFQRYLVQIFSYAGTASLQKEMQSQPRDSMQIGDVFIQGGFPGHAVIVVDMVENEAGEKLFLLAQSYMPAQDMHILKNPKNATASPWYALKDLSAELPTPEWNFSIADLHRFAN